MVERAESLTEILSTHFEWLAVYSEGRTFPLRADEIELDESAEKALIGMHGDKGFLTWRIIDSGREDDTVVLRLSRNLGSERQTVRLIPRTPARELALEIELARLVRANEIAKLLESNFAAFKIVRVALNDSNGRMANIIVESPRKEQTAVLADVTNGLTAENLLASAFLWLERLNSRRKKPITAIWVVAERKQARALRRLHTLLNRGARSQVSIVEVNSEKLKPLDEWSITEVWREKPRKLSIPSEVKVSKILAQITAINSDAIDTLRSKLGETARFHGLPFARVRSLMGQEQSWFGVGKYRRPLLPESVADLDLLVSELDRFRRHDSPNPRHQYYRSSPELWLESLLKRDIRKLDANLILSPIYNQFRSSTDKIDLLALRRDGRLVLIELKTSPDREAVFQAADYWRKIELQRRKGVLAKARLFGELEIKDEPTLVYVVAPALSFHHKFEYFAAMLASDIELWRFELHQEWRREIKVIARHEYR